MKILIFGASGSGTTTLGKELEKRSKFVHLDVDDYYWKVTQPPFQEKVALEERNQKLQTDFEKWTEVIVSGSLVSWGNYWENAFDLAVFLYLKPEIRLKRLAQREHKRYGDQLINNSQISKTYQAFMEWASHYDDLAFTGRSLSVHKNWIQLLSCPVLYVEGEEELNAKVVNVMSEIKKRLPNTP